MNPEQADAEMLEALEGAERALAEGRGLEGTGFWKAVGKARRDPALAARHADRIAAVDRRAFERGVRLRVPLAVGNLLLGGGTAAGLAAAVVSQRLDDPARTILFLGGFGAVLVCSHSLAHWLVGRAVGIGFTHYFLGGPPPPRPGAKTDYATYLRTPPRARALMHASGAVVTKIVPFAFAAAAWPSPMPAWVAFALLGLGVAQLGTDALLSTKTSDWMKVRRELRAARYSNSGSERGA